jgi:hypothetical protein
MTHETHDEWKRRAAREWNGDREPRCGAANPAFTHGKTRSPEYLVWIDMRRRCRNQNRSDFGRYGGRGIQVCERWQSFENFYADMGPRPDGTSLDRVDNNGNYEPENCRWATPLQQGNNKSNNRLIAIGGELVPVAEAARRSGINQQAIHRRLKLGWSDADALMTPVRKQRNNRVGL